MAKPNESIDVDVTDLAQYEVTVHLRSGWKLWIWLRLVHLTALCGRALGFSIEITVKEPGDRQ